MKNKTVNSVIFKRLNWLKLLLRAFLKIGRNVPFIRNNFRRSYLLQKRHSFGGQGSNVQPLYYQQSSSPLRHFAVVRFECLLSDAWLWFWLQLPSSIVCDYFCSIIIACWRYGFTLHCIARFDCNLELINCMLCARFVICRRKHGNRKPTLVEFVSQLKIVKNSEYGTNLQNDTISKVPNYAVKY